MAPITPKPRRLLAASLAVLCLMLATGPRCIAQGWTSPGSVGSSWRKTDSKAAGTAMSPDTAKRRSALQRSWDAATTKDPKSWKAREPERKPAAKTTMQQRNLMILDSLEAQQCLSTNYLRQLRQRATADAPPADGGRGTATRSDQEALNRELEQLLSRCLGRNVGPQYK